ncbi:11030_t:CDS:2 [Acaulospora morrowiae]|uniref:11030_t:CDS:1 n=1 Tax=Acaulospora morrowiae TaxID=94023 RepID=A0A9N9N5Z4_9GLOM|nr:11030_t:CDS:2 [Acaulospora morrowiae]
METINSQATEPLYVRQDSSSEPRKTVSFNLPQTSAESSSVLDDTALPNGNGSVSTEVSGSPEEYDDPFLLVSLRDQKKPPPRPKFVILLYLIALLDLAIVCICNLFLIHKENSDRWDWKKAEWDLEILAFLRFFVVVGVASSTWFQKLRWILGGACCLSSLYIIFKSNFMFQHKKPTHGYSLIIIASSFFFSQIHWVANIIVTTDARRRSSFLRDSSIYFEEEDSVNSRVYANDALTDGQAGSSSLRFYGATNDGGDVDQVPIDVSGGKIPQIPRPHEIF